MVEVPARRCREAETWTSFVSPSPASPFLALSRRASTSQTNCCTSTPAAPQVSTCHSPVLPQLIILSGLPKAAVIKHARYILASRGLTAIIGVRRGDVLYCPLPLYHSVGGMISLSGCISSGISMVIRDKFSASQYWSDCIRYVASSNWPRPRL